MLFVKFSGEPLARSSIKTHRTRKLSKRNPRGGGREEGEGEGVQSAPPISLFYHILSLDVMRFLHLFHQSNIALRVCILLVYCWCATVYVMTWHTGQYEYHMNERCHSANPCFFHMFFCVVFSQMGWRSHVMSSYVLEGGRNTNLSQKMGMVLLVPKANDMCAIFCVKKKTHLANDMK